MKLISKIASALAAVALTFSFVACNNGTDDKVDLEAVQTMLSKCQAALSAANTTDYPQEAITTF